MSIEEALDALSREICFVAFHFSDESVLLVCTTLSRKIMDELKVVFIKDCFYDLRRQKYIEFRRDADYVEVFTEEPELREVDKFANRFV